MTLLWYVSNLDDSIFENTSHYAVVVIILSKDAGEFVDILTEVLDVYTVCGYISCLFNFALASSVTSSYFVQQNTWEEENREKYNKYMDMEDVNRTSSYLGAAAPGGYYCRQDLLKEDEENEEEC